MGFGEDLLLAVRVLFYLKLQDIATSLLQDEKTDP